MIMIIPPDFSIIDNASRCDKAARCTEGTEKSKWTI